MTIPTGINDVSPFSIECDELSAGLWIANARGYGTGYGSASGKTAAEAKQKIIGIAKRMNLRPEELIDDNMRRLVASIAQCASSGSPVESYYDILD